MMLLVGFLRRNLGFEGSEMGKTGGPIEFSVMIENSELSR